MFGRKRKKNLANCERLRASFEGKDAIYIEKGVLHVNVSDIRFDLKANVVSAAVQELETPGFEGGLSGVPRRGDRLINWRISGGALTKISEHTWAMGYGGWSLFFAPDIVNGLLERAAAWPPDLAHHEKYKIALRYLAESGAYTPSEAVFS